MWVRGRVGRGVCLLGVLIGAVPVTLSGCSEEPPRSEARVEPVEVTPASQGAISETVRGVGSITALDAVPVRAEIAGRVTEVRFQEGKSVEEGEVLFSIEATELAERLRALESQLQAAQATAREATRTFERAEDLFRREILAAQELDELRARMEAAQAEVQRVEAEVASLREVLARSEVRAPFGGKVTQSEVDPGDFVQIGDPMVTVVRPSALEAEFWLPERHAGRVEPGMPVRVEVPSVADRTLHGEVVFVSPQVDPQSRTVLVKAALEKETKGELRPGLSATADVVVRRREGVVVPERSLVGTREGYLVYVVEEGVARARRVEVALREPGRVLLGSGVKPGEEVITQGQDRISDGDRVRVIDGEGEQVVAMGRGGG